MPLFKISGEQKATRLRVSEFSKERSLQNFRESISNNAWKIIRDQNRADHTFWEA